MTSLQYYKNGALVISKAGISPPFDQPSCLIVLLHGYGADENYMRPLAEYLTLSLSDSLAVCLRAPEPCPEGADSFQWFALDNDRIESRKLGPPKAHEYLKAKLFELELQLNISTCSVCLIGFSQGAMMALHTGLRQKNELLGVIAISGSLTNPLIASNIKTPVCLIHGREDEIVTPENSIRARRDLTELGHSVEFHLVDKCGHEISPQIMAVSQSYIQRQMHLKSDVCHSVTR